MKTPDRDFLIEFRAREMARPAFERARMAVDDIRSRYGDAVVAVLFYGSCLRLGDDTDKILDFYVIVDRYRRAYPGPMLALANKLLPPNVFYAETEAPGGIVRSKYAVLSVADLARRTTEKSLEVTFWARFAQPVGLLYARDDDARSSVAQALANSLLTLAATTAPLMTGAFSAADFWSEAFGQTYRAELRSESGQKPAELYHAHAQRYDQVTEAALRAAGYDLEVTGDDGAAARFTISGPRREISARLLWALRRSHGKTKSVLRLIKAAFTFDGGVAYLAWKISRHSGVEISFTPWQERHPVLTGIAMFWRLRRKGAFR